MAQHIIMSQPQLSTDTMTEDHPEIIRIKRGATDKQRTIADAIEEHAVVNPSGEIDITPVDEYLEEEHGENYTGKGYIWQIVGKLFVVKMPPEEDTSVDDALDQAMEYYRMGRKDEREQLREDGKLE